MDEAEEQPIEPEAGWDRRTFEMLFLPLYEDVYHLARYMLRDDGEAEDATQTTFAKAIWGLEDFEHHAKPRTWILRICRNECLDRVRRRKVPGRPRGDKGREGRTGARRLVSLDVLLDGSDDSSSGPQGGSSRDRERAREHLAVDEWEVFDWQIDCGRARRELTSEEDEAFELVDVQDHTCEEAASIVAVPPSTMRSRVSRSRRKLFDALRQSPASLPGDQRSVEIWGFYHSPQGNALVVSLKGENGRARAMQPIANLLTVLKAGARGRGAPGNNGELHDPIAFFGAVDLEVPLGQTLLALVDHSSMTIAAASWVADHPRWRWLGMSQEDWESEVAQVVHALDAGEREPVLKLINDSMPVVWFNTSEGHAR